ncbi:MAG: GTPase, partial [Actinomycetota bacterium]|nr:GTPase [Actinomycetota bacterium]
MRTRTTSTEGPDHQHGGPGPSTQRATTSTEGRDLQSTDHRNGDPVHEPAGTTPGGPQPGGDDPGSSVIDRILSRAGTALDEGTTGHHHRDGDQRDLADRKALRRVGGLSTELDDVTEVEYRQLRLERVVLAGLSTSGGAREAEVSLR